MASDDEPLLSSNLVVGYTINIPIATTCEPSKLCIHDCYAGNNPQSWTNALRKQSRVFKLLESDPILFAKRVCREYDKKKDDAPTLERSR